MKSRRQIRNGKAFGLWGFLKGESPGVGEASIFGWLAVAPVLTDLQVTAGVGGFWPDCHSLALPAPLISALSHFSPFSTLLLFEPPLVPTNISPPPRTPGSFSS